MTEPAAMVGAATTSLRASGIGKAVVGGDAVEAKAEQTRAATESSSGMDKKLVDKINEEPTKKPAEDDTQSNLESSKLASSNSEASAHWRAVQAALSDFLETVEAQVGLVLLIAVDTCASAAQIYIQTRRELADACQSRGGGPHGLPVNVEYGELGVAVAARALGAVSTLAMGIYVLELVVLLAVFRRNFLAHSGYAFDAALVAAMITIEAWTDSKAVRLIGVLRIWRVFRVVSTVVEHERTAHDASKALLDLERANAVQLRMEKLAAEESLKREYASRTGLERLLYDYKDEVATLKEALEIAAQAVAEAEMVNAQQLGSSIDPATGLAEADSDEQQYSTESAALQDQQAYSQSQLLGESAYSYDTDAYAYYQQMPEVLDFSSADSEKLPHNEGGDPESDFEDAIQSDSEPLE